MGVGHLQQAEAASFEPFACPRCRGPLEATPDGARCSTCESAYPVIGGLPGWNAFVFTAMLRPFTETEISSTVSGSFLRGL